jgi:hypothetical protein
LTPRSRCGVTFCLLVEAMSVALKRSKQLREFNEVIAAASLEELQRHLRHWELFADIHRMVRKRKLKDSLKRVKVIRLAIERKKLEDKASAQRI